MSVWPIAFEDVLAARERLRPYLAPTALRRYAPLDAAVGRDVAVWVKHENHQPTNAFKVRNALAALSVLGVDERGRGVVAASTGNHGQGVAFAGRLLGAPVTICVPVGNNPEKNEAMRGLGARLIEEGRDYDASVGVAERLAREGGLTMIHSTNNRDVIAGAGTLALEIALELEGAPLDAVVMAVGGGSQAVGALTVLRRLRPEVAIYGVQAERAPTIHDSWHAGHPVERGTPTTFADGVATRGVYALTFGALREGLTDFITVSEAELAEAVRVYLRTTHNVTEGAGAAGLAGVIKLGERLRGKTVAVVISGGNIDQETLRKILNREL